MRSWREVVASVAVFVGVALTGNGLALHLLGGLRKSTTTALMGAGLLCVALGLVAMRRRVARACGSPTFALTLIVGSAAVLGAAAFGLLSYVNARHFSRVHVADRGRGRLDTRTVKMLRALERPLLIVSTMVPLRSPLEALQNRVRGRANVLLAEYAKQSSRVSFLAFDAASDPAARARLRRELRLKGEVLRDAVIFRYGDDQKVAEFGQLLEAPEKKGAMPRFRGEAVFTGALLALVEGKRTHVCFVRGHGEKLVDDFDESGPGLSAIASLLLADNCEVSVIELPQIPDSCDVLVIPGPKTLLPLHEVQAVRQYARKPGKGLIVLLDPVPPYDRRGSGLEDVLGELGIVAETQHTIINVVRTLAGKRVVGTITTSNFPAQPGGTDLPPQWHPITKDLRQYRTVFDVACPVYVRKDFRAGPSMAGGRAASPNFELIRTAGGAFSRRGVDPRAIGDIKPVRGAERLGPFGLAVARGASAGARVVAVGDSDFVGNASIRAGTSGNGILFRNAVAWAAGREYKVGIPAEPFAETPRLDLRAEDGALAFWATVVAPPFHVMLIGFLIGWLRRR
ncbi:MAG: Gldg family protein [Candidatus Brocadiae bacterium]|nr:Gldg family protein [Candidatus Brocadiia bacterium]